MLRLAPPDLLGPRDYECHVLTVLDHKDTCESQYGRRDGPMAAVETISLLV
jgi:hypothetical protein